MSVRRTSGTEQGKRTHLSSFYEYVLPVLFGSSTIEEQAVQGKRTHLFSFCEYVFVALFESNTREEQAVQAVQNKEHVLTSLLSVSAFSLFFLEKDLSLIHI